MSQTKSPERRDLPERSFSALCWGYAGFASRAAVSLIYSLILARLLGPKPFGEVAAASLVIGFANLIADGGFDLALVQTNELTEQDIRFAFTLQLGVGGALTILCVTVAPVAAVVFHDPAVTGVLRWSSLTFAIQSIGQVSAALLKRHLEFRWLQTARVASSVFGYIVVGIPMAFLGFGVWSLVAAQLVQSATWTAMMFGQVRHAIIPCFNRRSLRLARFGAKVTATNIVNWCISNVDTAFVGRTFGPEALGLYSRAFNTVAMPAEAIVSTWQQVLFASCSRATDRLDAVRKAYLASLTAITLIMLPIFWCVAACSSTVVSALYGRLWIGLTPILPPLALGITVHAVLAIAGPVLNALGQVESELKAQLITVFIAIPAFLFATRNNVVTLAWTVLAVYVVRCVLLTRPALRMLHITWVEVLKAIRGPVFLAALASAVTWEIDRAAKGADLPTAITLPILALAALVVCVAAIGLAAEHISSPELLALVGQVEQVLPRMISRWLRTTVYRQQAQAESLQPLLADDIPPVILTCADHGKGSDPTQSSA